MKSINYFLLLLFSISFFSCGDDFEETTFEVIENPDVSLAKISGKVLYSKVDQVSSGLGTISENVVSEAIVRLYRENELLSEDFTREDGSYELEYLLESDVSGDLLLEIIKEGFFQSLEPIEPGQAIEKESFIFKNEDNVEPEPVEWGERYIVVGRVDVDEPLIVEVSSTTTLPNGTPSHAFSSVRSDDGEFKIFVFKGDEHHVVFKNELGCEAQILEGVIPPVFVEDTDLGDLSAYIDFVGTRELSFSNVNVPECLQGGQLIINRTEIDYDNADKLLVCDNLDMIEYFMINYDNGVSSELISKSQGDFGSIEFSDCRPYQPEFEISADFGVFTHDSEGVEVNSLYYSDTEVEGTDHVFVLDIELNQEWILRFRVEEQFDENGNFEQYFMVSIDDFCLIESVGLMRQDGKQSFSYPTANNKGFQINDADFCGNIPFVFSTCPPLQDIGLDISFRVPIVQ